MDLPKDLHQTRRMFTFTVNANKMKLKLISCIADRPDRRTIARTLSDIGDDVDSNLGNELTDILLEGSPIEIEVSFNESSAFRSLRKLDIDYEIVE